MAVRYIGQVTPAAGVQVQAGRTNIVAAASGGTLAGSQVIQLVWDDTVFDSSMEGKQRFMAFLENLLNTVQVARSWPIDTTS